MKKRERWSPLTTPKDGQIRSQIGLREASRHSDVYVCLYATAEPQQSSSAEAKLNGEGRLKAVQRPAASVFNHCSAPHLSLHADGAAAKGAICTLPLPYTKAGLKK